LLNSELNNRDQRSLKRAPKHSGRSSFNMRIELPGRILAHLHFGASGPMFPQFRIEQSRAKMPQTRAEAFGPFLVQSRIELTGRISVHFRFGASGTKIAQRHTGARGPIFARAGVALTHRTRTCLRHSKRKVEGLFGADGWQVPCNLSTKSLDGGAWDNTRSARRAASTGLWALLCDAQTEFARAW
jgi:hypothetical protein